jgi:hypothetical protein
MTRVAVLREDAGPDEMAFRAVAVHSQVMGRTAGEALDALASQLDYDESGTLIIVRDQRADRFFDASQRERLKALSSSGGTRSGSSSTLRRHAWSRSKGLRGRSMVL